MIKNYFLIIKWKTPMDDHGMKYNTIITLKADP